MSYASPEDVVSCFRNLDITASNSSINEDKIQTWLDTTKAQIDARFSALYSVPIVKASSPLSFKILAQIEAFYVAGIVDDIVNTYTQTDKKPQWEKRAEGMLLMYVPDRDKDGNQVAPTAKLPDATYIGTEIQKSKMSMQNITQAPIFKRGQDNW